MPIITRYYFCLINILDRCASIIPPLFLRLILALEFGTAGLEKLHGTNWFADASFPFPFNVLPPNVSWYMAMSFELAGTVALVLGLATRFFSVSLMILTFVAIYAVHWPEHWNTFGELLKGFRAVDPDGDGFGNYEIPLLLLIMFLPLVFGGAGKLSLDYCIKQRYFKNM